MEEFRAEMIRRGVYKTGEAVKTAAERKIPRGRMGGRRESWATFCERTCKAAEFFIAEHDHLDDVELLPCTLNDNAPCHVECRCGGTGKRTAGNLRAICRSLLREYGAAR